MHTGSGGKNTRAGLAESLEPRFSQTCPPDDCDAMGSGWRGAGRGGEGGRGAGGGRQAKRSGTEGLEVPGPPKRQRTSHEGV